MIPRGRHVPGTEKSQVFWTGVQDVHMSTAVALMAIFMDTRQNQTTPLTQPFEMRSSVIAKDVLLHTDASVEKNPAKVLTRSKFVTFSGGTSQVCFP